MKASGFEFRYRLWIAVAIYLLGFMTPWDRVLHLDSPGANAHVWGLLSAMLAKPGVLDITTAFNALLVLATVSAFAAAGLRTWATAYLGDRVMSDTQMHGERVVADGPFRHVRNPLYLGTWLNTVALALLMPASGAVFAVVGMVLFQMRLILREESLLRTEQGEAYAAYCSKVPRLLPAPGARVPATGLRPQWMRAAAAEIFLWGTAFSFAAVGWRYNAELLLQCVLVSFGVSLVVRAIRLGPEGDAV